MSLAIPTARQLVLDTGGLLAWAAGDQFTRALVRAAALRPLYLVIPSAVIAQTIRGGARDAPVNRLLNGVRIGDITIPPVMIAPLTGTLARQAGRLLGATATTDVVDAAVVVEACQLLPAIIVTSDPSDIHRLLLADPAHPHVQVIAV